MPETIVSILKEQLNSNLSGLLDPANYVPLDRAAKNRLANLQATAVSAEIKGNGRIIEFAITAPTKLKEDDVRAALS
jgi:hypothetical protein